MIQAVFPRSGEISAPQVIELKTSGPEMDSAFLDYRKYKSGGEWTRLKFDSENGGLKAELPQQPPAGKLEYKVNVYDDNDSLALTNAPVVIRFKGGVPLFVLIPHILLMFSAMLFSTRAGIEAIINGAGTAKLTYITLILLASGGMILGPVVQNYAFGAYWTGWPLGSDLTDNKTLLAFLGWVAAFIAVKKGKGRAWVIAASLILLAVYLIPHSMFGSELDYSTGRIGTGE